MEMAKAGAEPGLYAHSQQVTVAAANTLCQVSSHLPSCRTSLPFHKQQII